MVYVTEDFSGYDMSVIIGPTPDLRIKLTDHRNAAHTEMSPNGFTNIPQKCFYIRLGWLDDELAIVFANVLPEKIKAIVYLYDTGFCL